jgi:hypothetical protein
MKESITICTVKDYSRIMNISKQAVHLQIKDNKLPTLVKAKKVKNKYILHINHKLFKNKYIQNFIISYVK